MVGVGVGNGVGVMVGVAVAGPLPAIGRKSLVPAGGKAVTTGTGVGAWGVAVAAISTTSVGNPAEVLWGGGKVDVVVSTMAGGGGKVAVGDGPAGEETSRLQPARNQKAASNNIDRGADIRMEVMSWFRPVNRRG